jgi:DNA polymerase III delta prime subunit
MFENILSQHQVVAQLAEDIQVNSLPAALLFEGPEFSGKLSTALELARTLGCRTEGAPWSCTCSSCNAHRLLLEPRTILIGERYFMQEIVVAESVLLRARNDAATYLYQRAVRKLARRFDDFLWAGDEARLGKASAPLGKITEALDEISPGQELPTESSLAKLCTGIQNSAKKLCELLPSDNIPVDVVRRVSSWSRMTAGEEPKVVIFENADRMQESSRNALLKTLEEPPKNSYFLLLSSHKRALMPTILSRVRPYHFSDRTPEQARDVLRRIFRDDSAQSSSIAEYFVRTGFAGEVALDKLTEEYLDVVRGKSSEDVRSVLDRLDKQLKAAGGTEWARRFLESLTNQLHRNFRGSSEQVELSKLEQWVKTIEDHREYIELYRIPTIQVLEGLYFKMKG